MPDITKEYIPIFAGGLQTTGYGQKVDGDAIIEKAVAAFDPKDTDGIAACIGHPNDNTPAYGWIEDLKTDTINGQKVLAAKFKDVVPEFQSMLDKKMFKNSSAAFYPDGSLRHVAFLGATPPMIKNLKSLSFSGDSNFETYYYNIPNSFKQEVKEKMPDVKTFTEKEVQAQVEAALTAKELEFSEKAIVTASELAKTNEKLAASEAEKAELAAKVKDLVFSEQKAKISTFIDNAVEKGHITPAQRDAGLQTFMEKLEATDLVFSEVKDESNFDAFCRIITAGKKTDSLLFSEMSKEDVKTTNDPETLIKAYMDEHKVAYNEAAHKVALQRPELF